MERWARFYFFIAVVSGWMIGGLICVVFVLPEYPQEQEPNLKAEKALVECTAQRKQLVDLIFRLGGPH